MDFKWEQQVNAVLKVYGKHFHYSEYDDVKQDCRLAITEAGDVKHAALAYTIARNRIFNLIRERTSAKKRMPTFSLSDPKTMHIAEIASKYSTNTETNLAISEALSLLGPTERFVITHLFGIGVGKKTEEEVAKMVNKSRRKVHTLKESGLKKLKSIFTEK